MLTQVFKNITRRKTRTLSALPLGLVIAAPLAEYVFNPMLENDGALASSVGRILGVRRHRASQ